MKNEKNLKRFTVSIPQANYKMLAKYAARDGFIAPSQKARQYIIHSLLLEKDLEAGKC